ncbi:MAG TPA: hypothetical protein PKA95_12660 [Thermomicrobiales bacterium]|nr:hypothetical protein [Thermomicrobiales bacterium]
MRRRPVSTTSRTLLAIAALLSLALAGCGTDDATGGDATPTSPPASPTVVTIDHPTGADEVVLLIEQGGGLVPREMLVTSLPLLAVYGDGTVVTQGPVPAIYPGPALPNLRQSTITEAGLQALLAKADEAGLLAGSASYGDAPVADAPTTIFRVTARGETHATAVYALGIADPPASADPAEREARQRLSAFLSDATSLLDWLPASDVVTRDAEYEFERLQIVTRPTGASTATPDVQPGQADWPLATQLAELGEPYWLPDTRCVVIDGADLDTLLPALRQSNTLTEWRSMGGTWALFPRPLLPHEDGCPMPPTATPTS